MGTITQRRQGKRAVLRSKFDARCDPPDFGVFDDTSPQVFHRSLQHGPPEIVAVDIKIGERFEETTKRVKRSVKFGQSWRGLGVNQGGSPAICICKFDEVVFSLRFHPGPRHAAFSMSTPPADVVKHGAW